MSFEPLVSQVLLQASKATNPDEGDHGERPA